jgi:DNA-binding NtrC family response regulator
MHSIVLATADEDLRLHVTGTLLGAGRAALCCASWTEALACLATERTRVLLVDAALPGASGELLDAISRSVPHAPQVRVVRGALPPLPTASDAQIERLARLGDQQPFDDRDKKLLALIGLGGEPLSLVGHLATHPAPVWLQGERGSGKQWVARLIHRLGGADRPFAVLRPGEQPVIGRPGTIYVDDADAHAIPVIEAVLGLAEAGGWRVFAGSHVPPDPARDPGRWQVVPLRPLRERPKDIRPLARLYLDDWRRKLGVPARRVDAALWERIERHPWPGNQRELETFVVQAATGARGGVLSPASLPRRVLALLDAGAREEAARQGFEALVEARLRPFVERYEAGPGAEPLHALVIDATERALLRLALARTAGNQKAAAELLGIARNTLRERMARLDPLQERA